MQAFTVVATDWDDFTNRAEEMARNASQQAEDYAKEGYETVKSWWEGWF